MPNETISPYLIYAYRICITQIHIYTFHALVIMTAFDIYITIVIVYFI